MLGPEGVLITMINNYCSLADIDECEIGLCDVNSDCFNTLGDFQCVCFAGYMQEGHNCTGIRILVVLF